MADHLYKRGKIWWGIVWVDGERHRRSTQCTDKTAARAVLASWEQVAADPRRDASAVTLNDVLREYLDERRAVVASRTFDFYDEKCAQLAAVLGREFTVSLIVDSTHTRRYVSERRKQRVSDRTIFKELATLKAALRHAKWG